MMRVMTPLPQMITEVRRLGRIESDERALRWLRAAASTLAEWGGKEAREALESSLPKDLFSGAGTRGRSSLRAQSKPGSAAGLSLATELGRRAGQEDPGKIAQMAGPALATLRDEMPADQRDRLLAALPGDVAAEVRKATIDPDWRYFLIPQSYARP